QHALDLAAEVRVSGRVDDVDAVALPGDGGVLGQDRDATFLLLVVAVHHALGEHGAFGERARLLEQAVDEGGLAVVDVGDDGDVAEAFDGHDGNGQGAPELEGRARPSKWREPGSIPCCGAANAPAGERLNPLLQPAYRPGIPTPTR